MGAANGAVTQSAAKRAGEIDGAPEENAELAADIQKLIQMLMSMKNGGSPEALSGDVGQLLNKISGAQIPGLEGHNDFFAQIGQVANFANAGDTGAMLESIDAGFLSEGFDTNSMSGAQDVISSVLSPFSSIGEDLSGFNFLSGAA